jgi:hypothetical protein
MHRIRTLLLASAATALMAAPAAAAPVDGGERNPSNNASAGYAAETQIIGQIAQNAGGHAAGTGGYVTRQSNKSDTGGAAIYGCRSRTGTESCLAANNLSNGEAFRFQSTEAAGTIGLLRFGLDINKAIAKPPFVTNGTAVVKNLNADRLDDKSAEDFVEKGTLLFAAVSETGAIGANRGIVANGRATVAEDGTNSTFSVPFSGDLSKCVATASPATGAADGELIVGAPAANGTIAVTQKNATAGDPYAFSLQVTC